MEFWTSTLTEKSWDVLQRLSKEFKFIVIGGWGVWLWTKAHKSKDVDIIIEDYDTINSLRQAYGLKKNDRFRKYEMKIDEIDVDIYVPYYSQLLIPIEEVHHHITKVSGLLTVRPEMLLILKQAAEIGRRGRIKGQKDRIDVLTLLMHTKIDWKKYMFILKKYKKENFVSELIHAIKDFDLEQLKYLEMNPRQFKLWKEKIIDELRYLK